MFRKKGFLREYFAFSQLESRVSAFFMVLIFILVFFHFAMEYTEWFGSKNQLDPALFNAALKTYTALQNTNAEIEEKKQHTWPGQHSDKRINQEQLFVFDPNILSAEEFRNLGLDYYVINNILKYREKGGRFKVAKDFSRIFGLKPDVYAMLEPYIKIASVKPGNISRENKYTIIEKEENTKTLDIININTADSASLLKVRGIGPVFASRIIKYRNLLGGYYHIWQLTEVYGTDSDKINTWASQLLLEPGEVRKININEADEKLLASHPYIKMKLARVLINYRKQHGNYKDINDLKAIKILKPEDLSRLEPYLAFH